MPKINSNIPETRKDTGDNTLTAFNRKSMPIEKSQNPIIPVANPSNMEFEQKQQTEHNNPTTIRLYGLCSGSKRAENIIQIPRKILAIPGHMKTSNH